ncbi:type I restriction-modification system, DNA-methyltransferase subunit M [Pseudanabaena sp. lw0831]|uniref:N-6 DNA methylase n=1 Tax=Pseudanabaena sp. lw0831 TaxID=1357935 RepID=UPI00191669DF|nr:N-6 DNA methylase [Pseudanabaena sp. lw0831]GBO55055.1 type I restriction-modification system, DNA-methyltransferase subunit M [Pseudanabaena sp. lw0831]
MINEQDYLDIAWKLFDLGRGINFNNRQWLSYSLSLLFLRYIFDLFFTQSTTIPNRLEKLIGKIQWDDFTRSSNIGEALDKAVNKIIEANPDFKVVLSKTEFSRIPERTLNQMISILSNPQIKDNGFGLFSHYATISESILDFEASNQKFGGENFTPKWVTQLMARLVDPQKGTTIHDPVCGTGGLFVECAKLLSQKDQDFPQLLHFFGQEKNDQTSKICQINLLLHGLDPFKVQTGDTLRDPKFMKSNNLEQFDIVVANPPLNTGDWGYEEVDRVDKLNRFRYGIPPRKNGDFAFIQHIIATMKPDSGKAVILVSPGVLFRSGVEQDIRAGILDSDLVEAAIVLPTNLLYNTNIPLAILVLNRSKPTRKNKVLIIDASNEYKKLNRGVNSFDTKNIDDIVEIFNNFEKLDKNKSGLAKFTSLQDIENIKQHDYQLNANRYITAPRIKVDVEEKRVELHYLEIERLHLENKMDQILEDIKLLR